MARKPIDPLTPREEDVLGLLRRGLTNEQIAGELGISENTAKDHVSSILRKLAVRSRDEASFWPREAPWWARAPLVAPVALLVRRSAARLPISPSFAVSVVAGTALIAVIGSLGLLALLLLQTNGSATPVVVSNDIRDLQPGMTVHLIGEKYRRYGPAADIYAEHFPENGSELQLSETWMVFDEDGNLSGMSGETRSESGDLLGTAGMEGMDIVLRDADGAETSRIRGALKLTTVDSYRDAILGSLDLIYEELDEHPDAPVVTFGDTEFLLIESRRSFSRGVMGPASPSSFSAPYLYDLEPLDHINRQYFSRTSNRYRLEDWVVDADGVETLVEYTDSVLFEILEN